MGIDRDEEQFEAFLRQFRPQAPRPLPGKRLMWIRRRRGPLTAAVAAIVVLVAAAGIVHFRKPNHTYTAKQEQSPQRDLQQEVSLGRLNMLLREDPAKLSAVLDQASPALLPDVEHGPGILKALSAE